MTRIDFRTRFAGGKAIAEGLYSEDMGMLANRLQLQVSRISHVEPANWVLRRVFHAADTLFGDRSRAGHWVRTWKCRWRVNFGPSGGDIFDCDDYGKPFSSRAAAIAFEIPRAQQLLEESCRVSADEKRR